MAGTFLASIHLTRNRGETHGGTFATGTALRLLAAFSRHGGASRLGAGSREEVWGPVRASARPLSFRRPTITKRRWDGLSKIFFVFANLCDPATVVDAKLQTGIWEHEYTARGGHEEPRPLNLDPGYVTSAKLVLASTKDHAHRIYLSRGIYAEVTLYYRDRAWQHHPWTFPDYRRADYQEFFVEARLSAPPDQAGLPMIPWLVLGAIVPSAVVAGIAAGVVRRNTPAWGLVDEPGHRKVHVRTTPLGGGIAIWLGVVVPLAIGQLLLWLMTRESGMPGLEWRSGFRFPILCGRICRGSCNRPRNCGFSSRRARS